MAICMPSGNGSTIVLPYKILLHIICYYQTWPSACHQGMVQQQCYHTRYYYISFVITKHGHLHAIREWFNNSVTIQDITTYHLLLPNMAICMPSGNGSTIVLPYKILLHIICYYQTWPSACHQGMVQQ